MTTTHIGTVRTIFGIDSIEATINAMVGDFAADFDMEAAANGYRDYLTDYLPATLVVVGNDVMCHIDDVQALNGDGPIEEIRDAIRDDMAAGDGFDISRYAKPACAQCGAAGRNADSHTCGTKQPESAEQNTPATLGDDLRRLADLADTGLLEGDSFLFTSHVESAARVQAVADRLHGKVSRYPSSHGSVQASSRDGRIGSIEVCAIAVVDTPWSDDAETDEVWAEIVRGEK